MIHSLNTEMSMQDIENHLAAQYEGKAFEHIWLCKIGEEYSVQKDYYAIINGTVFELHRNERNPSGDSIFETVRDCICIGDYDPNGWYQRIQRTYEHGTFKALTGINAA